MRFTAPVTVLALLLVSVASVADPPSEDDGSERWAIAYEVVPKYESKREEARSGNAATLKDKMQEDDHARYLAMPAALDDYLEMEVWTIGEKSEMSHHEDRPGRGPMMAHQSGHKPTSGERSAISAIAPIVWESTLSPMAMVAVTDRSQFEMLGALPFVYFLETYPATEVQSNAVYDSD